MTDAVGDPPDSDPHVPTPENVLRFKENLARIERTCPAPQPSFLADLDATCEGEGRRHLYWTLREQYADAAYDESEFSFHPDHPELVGWGLLRCAWEMESGGGRRDPDTRRVKDQHLFELLPQFAPRRLREVVRQFAREVWTGTRPIPRTRQKLLDGLRIVAESLAAPAPPVTTGTARDAATANPTWIEGVAAMKQYLGNTGHAVGNDRLLPALKSGAVTGAQLTKTGGRKVWRAHGAALLMWARDAVPR